MKGENFLMESICKIWGVFFSPTRSTEKAVLSVAKGLIGDMKIIDISMPGVREQKYTFNSSDTVVLGTPTYAGRVPNKIMPFFRDNIKGAGTRALIVVTYGNRSYGDCLMEMITMAETNGFEVVGAAAVPCEHAFAPSLAAGRPDENDLDVLGQFGCIAERIIYKGDIAVSERLVDCGLDMRLLGTPQDPFLNRTSAVDRLKIPGSNPVGPYYVPKKPNGEPAVFLKAKPVTDMEKCIGCGFCWRNCPMGSIEPGAPETVSGVCIKCQRCIKRCPAEARSFTDEDFLLHKQMLEENFGDTADKKRKEVEIYL